MTKPSAASEPTEMIHFAASATVLAYRTPPGVQKTANRRRQKWQNPNRGTCMEWIPYVSHNKRNKNLESRQKPEFATHINGNRKA
jgi:hypothetical protein